MKGILYAYSFKGVRDYKQKIRKFWESYDLFRSEEVIKNIYKKEQKVRKKIIKSLLIS